MILPIVHALHGLFSLEAIFQMETEDLKSLSIHRVLWLDLGGEYARTNWL